MLSWALCFVSRFLDFWKRPPHIILGVNKQRDLGNEFCQTVEDALRGCLAQSCFAYQTLFSKTASWVKLFFFFSHKDMSCVKQKSSLS
jgi:hypothetical protein